MTAQPCGTSFGGPAGTRVGDLVTHVAFTHYNAVHALKLAMEAAGSTDRDEVFKALGARS